MKEDEDRNPNSQHYTKNYLVDKDYNKESEVSIKWDSVPDVKETITKYMSGWNLKIIINDKDEEAITLEEYGEKYIG